MEQEGELTRLEKAAIIISSIPQEIASQVLRHMDTTEIEKVTTCMTKMSMVPSEVVDETVNDFLTLATQEAGSLSLGKNYVESLVSKSLGEDKAKALVNKVSRGGETKSLELLETLDPETLSDLTRNEHPQTIALILTHLSPEKAGGVLSSLSEDLRADVILRISNLDRVSPDVINEVAEMLESEAKLRGGAGDQLGGVKTVADILNQLDHATESALIGKIEEADPKMADQIRQLMFIFEDLALIDDRGMQEILKEVSSEDLARALKTASEAVKDKIFKNMSERAVTMLNEDLEDMGPIRLSEVERAQQAITQVALRLEEEGKITVGNRGGGEEVFV
jgi:flagellar motor switch protein FliG